MLGKIEGRRRSGTTEDETIGWYHRLNGHEFEQTPGDSEGLGSLACCSPWGHKESDTTEWLNNEQQQRKNLGVILESSLSLSPLLHSVNRWESTSTTALESIIVSPPPLMPPVAAQWPLPCNGSWMVYFFFPSPLPLCSPVPSPPRNMRDIL